MARMALDRIEWHEWHSTEWHSNGTFVTRMALSRNPLSKLLEMMGNKVCTAHDGKEAVQAALEFRPHVVLCDIGLPKLNGYEACRQMREHAWDKNMLLIAVSGWGQDEDRQKSTSAGFDHHLVKPVDRAALTKLLAGLIFEKV